MTTPMTAPSIKEALEQAIQHIEHMAAWITGRNQDPTKLSAYSFESLGEDLPGMKAALSTLSPQAGELSGISGELRDKVAEAIRGDGIVVCDTPWETLSDKRKLGWRCDADRALAVVKDYLTTRHQPDGERREAIARIIDPFAYHAYDLHKVEAHRGRTGFVDKDGEPTNYAVRRGVIAARVIADAILASGLVQGEAGWRDISTAPKDGRYILAARFKRDEFKWAQHSRWMTPEDVAEQEGGEPEDYEAGWTDGEDDGDFCYPTHWMPLPAPPIRSGRDGGAES